MAELTQEDRRHFSRILFDAECVLSQSDMEWTTQILDISLKGILVKKPDHFSLNRDDECQARITLADHEQSIEMSLKLIRESDTHLGFQCLHIDLDSITHLKRLVELNLGDEALLNRELNHLMDDK